MGQNTEERILEIFYENPGRDFTVREISKLTRLPRSTVHKYLTLLKKQKILTSENRAAESILFKTKKTNFFIEKIVKSGLVEEITSHLNPSCIILFGSIRKGDSNKESDIDIFIETSIKKDINLGTFEKILKHKIQIFSENKIHNFQENLFNNIVNGIKLYGNIKIK